MNDTSSTISSHGLFRQTTTAWSLLRPTLLVFLQQSVSVDTKWRPACTLLPRINNVRYCPAFCDQGGPCNIGSVRPKPPAIGYHQEFARGSFARRKVTTWVSIWSENCSVLHASIRQLRRVDDDPQKDHRLGQTLTARDLVARDVVAKKKDCDHDADGQEYRQ